MHRRSLHLSEHKSYRPVKRALDIGLAGLGLLLAAPILICIWLSIRLDSPGPVIFTQPRLGYRRKIFGCYKFRTMLVNSEREGVKPLGPDDSRLTRMGRWLRRSSLDELPQLLNVLRGDMSMVGPRPEQPFLLARYPEGAQRRFDVVPGLTGWWQVNGRLQPMYEHLYYDLYYVDHQSMALDMRILLMTIRAVFSGEGAV
jgi:lipopolysaccharide/colanic/teichoic acid biosynthesis glycosyltransferase